MGKVVNQPSTSWSAVDVRSSHVDGIKTVVLIQQHVGSGNKRLRLIKFEIDEVDGTTTDFMPDLVKYNRHKLQYYDESSVIRMVIRAMDYVMSESDERMKRARLAETKRKANESKES